MMEQQKELWQPATRSVLSQKRPSCMTGLTRMLLCLGIVLSLVHDKTNAVKAGEGNANVRKCQPIAEENCRGLGYSMTGMPNLVSSSFNLLRREMRL